ncbi:MAG: putative rane protein [Pedosphaera sp.]|nr:putative rane protein [Pedosphaera sp.]
MAINSQPSTYVPLLLMGFVGWRMIQRVRRNIGRQPLQPKRMIARIVIFAVVALLFGAISLLHTELMLGFGAGLVLGVPLALVGLRLTRFEATPEGHFYTPNTYIGVALSVLLVVRLFCRMFKLYSVSETTGLTYAKVGQSALTLFLFGLLASYYIAYFTGVFVRCRSLKP